ncbi:MAG TPA: ATP-binding protein [Spirochaetales bacterium]|nr:ATP-binding protein [Spirochaetales bacterium]
MRVATRLKIAIALTIGLSTLGLAFVAASLVVTTTTVDGNARLQKLVSNLYEIRILSLEYENANLDRTARQWRALYRQVGDGISTFDDMRPEILVAYRNAGASFEAIVAMGALEDRTGMEARARAQRFATLHIETQRVIDWAKRDAELKTTRLLRALRDAGIGIAAAMFSIGFVAIALVARLGRHILSSIDSLGDGTARIARGEFSLRLPASGGDELSGLASSFNAMASGLEASYADLETKNAELERFTYTVSHDLKSPLITIRGFLGYLVEDAESGDTTRLREDIGRITAAAAKMERLLGDLLALSRIGRKANPPERFPMRVALDEALSRVEGSMNASGATVRVGELGEAFADRERIIEVWQNLVENAIKYAKPGVPPALEAASEPRDGRRAFLLRDNGIGIKDEYRDKAFALFEKIDPKSEGTGIGLALVKRIVEVHGGRVWIEDGIDGGSTFIFTLADGGSDSAA